MHLDILILSEAILVPIHFLTKHRVYYRRFSALPTSSFRGIVLKRDPHTRTLDLWIYRSPKKRARWKTRTPRPKSVGTCLMSHERQCWNDSFWYKKWSCARPRFYANNVWKAYHKLLFWKRRNWYKIDNCQFVALISMKRFRMLKYF